MIATARLKITVTGSVTPSTYTIRYDANGGKNAPAPQAKTAQHALTLSREFPTRDGYTFAGWATTKDGSAQYQPGGQYTTDRDVTLYAVWKKVESNVSLTLAKSSFEVSVGEQAKIDFTFTGTVDSVSYRIDNESICKFADGEWKQSQHKGNLVVKALSPGTTNVTVMLCDKNDNVLASKVASVKVSSRIVSSPADATLTLLPHLDNLHVGDEVILNFTFTGEIEGVAFEMSDESVLTQTGGGSDVDMGYFSFEAISPGTTNVTIFLYEGRVGGSYTVLASKTVSITVSGRAEVPDDLTLTLYPYITDVAVGDEAAIHFDFTGEVDWMDFYISDDSILEDPNIVIDNDLHKGHFSFKALSPGTTDITIMLYKGDGFVSESFSINVIKTISLIYSPSSGQDYGGLVTAPNTNASIRSTAFDHISTQRATDAVS